jgi:hypothetical protein
VSASDVVELDPSDPRATVCGACGRGWDDSVSTSCTPVPSGRCPFEYEHEHEHSDKRSRVTGLTRATDNVWDVVDDALSAAVGVSLATGGLLDREVGGWNAYGETHSIARELCDALERSLTLADLLCQKVQEVTDAMTEDGSK